jgi:hypothetical protein
LHSTRSPAAYHRAVVSESFLKTHAIAGLEILRWSPRAFQKISNPTAQWSPMNAVLARQKIASVHLKTAL